MRIHNGAYLSRGALLSFAPALTLVLLTACASAPVVAPTAALAEARQAIAGAEQSGGEQYASGQLDQAKEKLVMAERAVDREDMVEAERLASEATVTAELASATTASVQAEEINREMGRGARALTEEMRRMGEQQ